MKPLALSIQAESGRRRVGLAIYLLGMALGGVLVARLIREGEPSAMAQGALFALPMLLVYLWLPWIVDRYDPEPVWALSLVLGWGALAATGFAAHVNTAIEAWGTAVGGEAVGTVLGTCIGAPVVEELLKGVGVFLLFYCFRREFDGVVDGVVYATFTALGFAAIENVLYYGGAAQASQGDPDSGAFVFTFVLRGILSPWVHPLATSMTGLGFGISRETNHRFWKWAAPFAGYGVAVLLHATWNTAATISGWLTLLMLPLWLLFVAGFGALVIFLVVRKGRIIRDHLQDEIMMGILTPWEVTLVGSPVAHLRATLTFGGSTGRAFVSAASRLALSKWHTGRATRASKLTLSAGMILPLRQELGRLRAEIARKTGRTLETPRMAVPGTPPRAPLP